MRKIIIIFIFFIGIYSNAYGAYNGTMPKDIGTSTPLGSENPNVIDDVLRERGTILYNVYKIKSVGTDTAILSNDSWVIASSTSSMLITMPSASSAANGSATKPFFIKNINTGTVTLNISVDGVGSPTVTGSQTMCLFSDGTSWFEIKPKNAGNADSIGNVVAAGYARSGANSDITSLSGLTTALPISEGGTGQTTAAAANTAFGLGTGNTPTFTGVIATGSSTLATLNSTTGSITTLTSTTGNITNQVTTTGTVTTLYSTTGNITTGNITNLNSTTGTVTTLNSTTGNITTGNVTDLAATTGSVTTLNSTTGNITNLVTTNGTITTLNSTTGNITNQVTTTGTIATLNNTNLVSTTGTITTINNTNFSGGTGTFTGNISAVSASGFNYLDRWRSGAVIGTGTLAIQGSGDIITTPTYSNGAGTITVSLAGSASAKINIWSDTTQIIANAPDASFAKTFSVTGSGTTWANIDIAKISLGTQTGNVIGLGTQTGGFLSLGTQTGGLLSLATQTADTQSLTPTDGKVLIGIPDVIYVNGTTTAATTGTATQFRTLLSYPTLFTQSAGSVTFSAANGTLSASSTTIGSNPGNAFDGTTTTQWESDGSAFPQWIQYKFNVPKVIDQIQIWAYNSGSGAELGSFTVHGSTDGVNFGTISSGLTGTNTDNSPKLFTFAGTTTPQTYWRITHISNGYRGDAYTGIREVQMALSSGTYTTKYTQYANNEYSAVGGLMTSLIDPGTATAYGTTASYIKTLKINADIQFSGTDTTGVGTASLGGNCPAVNLSSPYKWIEVITADGSVCLMPVWKK